MEQEGFSAGVVPGGLRTQSEVRLLLCYLLTSIKEPISKNDMIVSLQSTGLANYFELSSALADLLKKKNIDELPEDPSFCVANDATKQISRQLMTDLPPSVRDRAVAAVLQQLALAKRERENKVEIHKQEVGYQVDCHISDGSRDLMQFSLWVPDQFQARVVKKNFHHHPEMVYRVMLCLMTDQKDYLETLLHEF